VLTGADLRVQLWDGRSIVLSDRLPVATVVIGDRATLVRLLYRTDLEFGEAYSAGRLEVQGNLVAAIDAIDRALAGRPFQRRRPRARRIAPSSSRHNVHTHYDLGNDFYRLWLDEQLVYTCAYFETPETSLEAAQVAKMDHVCRKLQLNPGERVIEAGCGWGALALHMAKHYGVSVRAYNVSREQVRYARERAQQEGLADRVEFIEDDWRNISGTCDAFVSVGMLEHVGPENCRQLGDVIHSALEPNGRGLIHTIGMNYNQRFNRWIEERIFPGAQPPSLRQMLDVFEPHDFSVYDVENLRPHYELTLKHWLARFEAAVPTIREMYDETFIRMWRMYLAASVTAFETGGLQLFQVVILPASRSDVPWTRSHLYRSTTPANRSKQ
jgi:cyclopropane-fatty-acyl-phospholipid synthase